MRIIEFRVFLPFTLNQTRISSRYTLARRSKEETKGGDGVEIIEKKDITSENNKGVYVHRVYHIKAHAPSFVRWAIPESYGHVHEYYENCYPNLDTRFMVPGMGNSMTLTNTTRHIAFKNGDEIPDNLANLTDSEKEIRTVCYLDLLNGPKSMFGDFNCRGKSCEKAGIHEMVSKDNRSDESKPPSWIQNYDGPMTLCVKVIKFDFQWRGLQSSIEKYVTHTVFHDMFLGTYRAQVVWAEDWYNLSDEDIDAYESSVQEICCSAKFEQEAPKTSAINNAY